jgi:hypothetical protein
MLRICLADLTRAQLAKQSTAKSFITGFCEILHNFKTTFFQKL